MRAAPGVRRQGAGRARPGRCSSSCSTSSTSTRPATARARSRRSCSTSPSAAAPSASILIGAQQTASEVERRVVANSAVRVVGRLDAAEAGRGEYGFLPAGAAAAGHDPQAGHDDREPARAAGPARARVPVPGVGHPAPARPARPIRRAVDGDGRPTIRSRGCRMKFLHTADWHVGKTIRGRSRADEHRRRARRDRRRSREARAVDAVLVVRRPVRHGGADARVRAASSTEALLDSRRAPAPAWSSIAGNHDNDRRLQAVAARCSSSARSSRRPRVPPARRRRRGRAPVPGRRRAGAVALLPFLSQRWIVRADELMATAATEQAQAYAERMRLLIAGADRRLPAPTRSTSSSPTPSSTGGVLGGGERAAQTILRLRRVGHRVPGHRRTTSPSATSTASQGIAGPCPIRYCRLAAAARLRRDRATASRCSSSRPTRARPVELREHR